MAISIAKSISIQSTSILIDIDFAIEIVIANFLKPTSGIVSFVIPAVCSNLSLRGTKQSPMNYLLFAMTGFPLPSGLNNHFRLLLNFGKINVNVNIQFQIYYCHCY